MAVSLNTFAHLAIIFLFIGIFSWNLLDYREGLNEDENEEDENEEDENEDEANPKKKLSEEEKEELARKNESEAQKFKKMRQDAKKYVADLEDRL